DRTLGARLSAREELDGLLTSARDRVEQLAHSLELTDGVLEGEARQRIADEHLEAITKAHEEAYQPLKTGEPVTDAAAAAFHAKVEELNRNLTGRFRDEFGLYDTLKEAGRSFEFLDDGGARPVLAEEVL